MNIDALKKSVNCLTVANDLGMNVFENNGRKYARCFRGHDSKSGTSFSINHEFFKCWNCGVSGDVVALVMESKGVEFRDAYLYLAERYAPHLLEKTDTRKFIDCLDTFLNYTKKAFKKRPDLVEPFIKDIERRGLKPDIVDKYGIGYAHPKIAPFMLKSHIQGDLIRSRVLSDSGTYHNSGRMTIPITHFGRTVGYIGRYGDPKTLTNSKIPQDNFLFLLDDSDNSVVVCEGDFDTIKVREAGFNACGLLGCHVSKTRLRLLRKFERIVLMLDNDEPGYKTVEKIFFMSYGILDHSKIFVAQYDQKDPCDETLNGIRQGVCNSITIWEWMYRRNYECFIEK